MFKNCFQIKQSFLNKTILMSGIEWIHEQVAKMYNGFIGVGIDIM